MSLETAKRRYFVQYQSEFSAQRDAILELLKKSPNDTEGLSRLTRSIQNEITQTLTNEFGHEVAQETAGVIVHEYLIPQAKADVPRMSRIFHPGYFYVLGILLIVSGFLAYVFTIGTPAGESFLALAFVGIVCVVIATYLSKGKTARVGGVVAINPSGGLKAKGHPIGATGISQVFEVVTQLRGAAGPRQVPNAKIGLTHNIGGTAATCVVHIFREAK